MDPEKVDSVTADCLEPGDIIQGDSGNFYTITGIDDRTSLILVSVEGEDEPLAVMPDQQVDLFLYPAVDLD